MTNQPQFDQPTRQPAAAPVVTDQGYQPPVANPVPDPDQEVAVPELGIVSATPVGHRGVRVAAEETDAWSVNGGIALMLLIALGAVSIGFVIGGGVINATALTVLGVVLFIAMYFGFTSLTVIQPGETKVLQFLGRYVGTIRKPGLQLTTPFTSKRRVSVKVNNFETHELKVNDSDGNPVNIAAIIVWQIADTAKASFAVENSQHFVEVQAESALRHVASTHPYDTADPGQESLRGSTELVAAELAIEVAARVAIAGIEIVEARISSLAYAPEIAHAMLQRQQAAAVIAARSMIVEGAVGMVEQALRRLETDSVVQLNEERKAQMVANLLLVLCGDSRATPVINTNQ
jgi:regulator of protease activity HflC (stomatin/prohibitin superfamily)